MALSSNPFSAFFGKFAANQELLTTAATIKFLDRTHHSSSGHSGEGHHYHYSSSKKKKKSIAMNALTLLSFLFFLNILQNCIQEHINHMNPTTIVMQMQTTMATLRKFDIEGNDDGELFNNATSFQSESIKNNLKIKKHKISTNVVRRKSTSESRKRNKMEEEKVEIKPTRTTIVTQEGEYQYSRVPIKIKTVKGLSYNENP